MARLAIIKLILRLTKQAGYIFIGGADAAQTPAIDAVWMDFRPPDDDWRDGRRGHRLERTFDHPDCERAAAGRIPAVRTDPIDIRHTRSAGDDAGIDEHPMAR